MVSKSFVILHCKHYGFKDLDEFNSCDLNSKLLVAVTILQSYGLDHVEQIKRSKTASQKFPRISFTFSTSQQVCITCFKTHEISIIYFLPYFQEKNALESRLGRKNLTTHLAIYTSKVIQNV